MRTLTFVEFCEQILKLVLTPAQRVMCLVVFDAIDPIDLATEAERAIAAVMFGGIDRIPEDARTQLCVFRLGRWSGKTLIVCAARAIYRMCTADISMCGPGDIPAVTIIAPTAKTAKIAMNTARALINLPVLKPMIVQSSAEGFTLRRPQDGREVECMIVAKSHGGASLRGFSLIEVFLDEAEFVPSGGADAKISDTDLVDAAMPRLTEGARMNLVSTPWPAPSETAKLFAENFGKPTTAIAVCATTPMMRDNSAFILKKIEKEMRRKPENAQREFYCILVDGGGGAFFELTTIAAALKPTPAGYQPTKVKASAGVDPAFVNDSFGLVVVERGNVRRLTVTGMALFSPEPQRPLVPSQVIHACAEAVKQLGCRLISTDVHRVKTIRDNAANEQLQVYVGPGIEEAMVYLREVLREQKLDIHDTELGRELVAQLKTVLFKPRTGGGLTIIMPRVRGGGHADLVAALAQAVYFDRRHGPLLEAKAGRMTGGGRGGGTPPFPGFMG